MLIEPGKRKASQEMVVEKTTKARLIKSNFGELSKINFRAQALRNDPGIFNLNPFDG